MAAESGCVLHCQQQKLSSAGGGVDKDEWNDFNGFETTTQSSSVSQFVAGDCGLSENCANSQPASDECAPLSSAAEATSLLHDAVDRCFCLRAPDAVNNVCSHSASPLPDSQAQDAVVCYSRSGLDMWRDEK